MVALETLEIDFVNLNIKSGISISQSINFRTSPIIKVRIILHMSLKLNDFMMSGNRKCITVCSKVIGEHIRNKYKLRIDV